jgi:TolB protein
MITSNKYCRLLFSTLALLSVAWLAAPLASENGANDGFILFTTDRDNPSDQGMCNPPQCEDIYVMAPAFDANGVHVDFPTGVTRPLAA